MLKCIDETEDLHLHGLHREYRPRLLPNFDFGKSMTLVQLYSRMRALSTKLNTKSLETDVRKIVKIIEPDVILIDSFFPPSPSWRNMNQVEEPKAIIITDPHYMLRQKLQYVTRNGIDLAAFECKFTMQLPEFLKWRERNDAVICEWLPHSVDTKVFRDYGKAKSIDVFSSGRSYKSIYPLRNRIKEVLASAKDLKFVMPEHAADQLRKGKSPDELPIRQRYAQLISRAKILAFGASIYRYPVMKYFEGMACNTLVAAPIPRDARELGFTPGRNFVEIDEDNFPDKIRYYLRNDEERDEISQRGMEMIVKKHDVRVRKAQLIEQLKSII